MQKSIHWWTPVMGDREKQRIAQVIDKGFPNDGPLTREFEKRIAEICEMPHAVATTSGTAALFLALSACGVGLGDEVIVPDVTFIATANAVSLTGARPVLVDVDRETFCMTPETAGDAITDRTKALVPVHISGRAAPMEELLKLAEEHGLKIVEDAAEALGSRYRGRQLGTFGDAGCFSFTPNKTFTTGQGGMVVTRDAETERRLRELKDQGRPARGTGGADTHVSLGYNFKFTDLQAAVGLAQLEDFQRRIRHLQDVYGWYRAGLSGIPGIHVMPFDVRAGICPQWVDLLVEQRDGLHDSLLASGIPTRKYWYALHTQAPYKSHDDAFPNSLHVSSHALWLPCSFDLGEDDIALICSHIRSWARDQTT